MAKIVRKSIVSDSPNQSSPVRPKSLLERAHDAIYGEKEASYGDPAVNIQQIADYWSIHLSRTVGEKIVLTSADVCEMMILLKVARLASSPEHTDSVMDIAGYAGLQDRIVPSSARS